MQLRGRRSGKGKSEEELAAESAFVDVYNTMDPKKKSIKRAAMQVRPELSPDGAHGWGKRVLKDPEVRKRMHAIEQGGLYRLRELVDLAIDAIFDALIIPEQEDSIELKKLRVKAADILLKRVYGAIPDTVNLIKFSIFDGMDNREFLREQLKRSVEATARRDFGDIIDTEVTDGPDKPGGSDEHAHLQLRSGKSKTSPTA